MYHVHSYAQYICAHVCSILSFGKIRLWADGVVYVWCHQLLCIGSCNETVSVSHTFQFTWINWNDCSKNSSVRQCVEQRQFPPCGTKLNSDVWHEVWTKRIYNILNWTEREREKERQTDRQADRQTDSRRNRKKQKPFQAWNWKAKR